MRAGLSSRRRLASACSPSDSVTHWPLRDVEHQAATAIGAAAGMMGAGRDDHETLLAHLTALALDLEIQRARQPEHQLSVVVAVDDQIVGVLDAG